MEAGADSGTRWWQLPHSPEARDPMLALSLTWGQSFRLPGALSRELKLLDS